MKRIKNVGKYDCKNMKKHGEVGRTGLLEYKQKKKEYMKLTA